MNAKWVYWDKVKLLERNALLGIIRDFGVGAESVRQGMERVLKSFCTVHKGRRDKSSMELPGAEDVLDGELFATLQRATWLVMADKAGDEQNAIAVAARDGLLPNLVGPNWDPAHCIRACTKTPFRGRASPCGACADASEVLQ